MYQTHVNVTGHLLGRGSPLPLAVSSATVIIIIIKNVLIKVTL